MSRVTILLLMYKNLVLSIIILIIFTCVIFASSIEDADKLMKEGNELAGHGDYKGALAKYEEALKICREKGNEKDEGIVSGNIGTIYEESGEYEKALEYYNKALTIARKTGDLNNEGRWIGNIGIIYKNFGDYQKALEYYNKALEIARKIGDVNSEGINLGNIAVVYNDLGDYQKSLEYYNKALEIVRKIGDVNSEGINLGNIGFTYSELNDYPKALQYYNDAIKVNEKIGVPYDWIERDKGDVYFEQGNLDKAFEIYNNLGWSIPLGRYYLAIKDCKKAKEKFATILEKSEKQRDSINLLSTCTGLGLSEEGLKNYSEAEKYYRKAVDLIEHQRETLPRTERKNFFEGKVNGFRKLEPYEGLCRIYHYLDRDSDSFFFSESTKARVFAEEIAMKKEDMDFHDKCLYFTLKGSILISEGKYDEGNICLEKSSVCYSEGESLSIYYYFKANDLYAQGKTEEGEEYYDKAIKADFSNYLKNLPPLKETKGDFRVVFKEMLKGKSQGLLAACESNMKNIATALEMYATDNSDSYPASLKILTPDYLRYVPECPECKKPYRYEKAGLYGFILTCGEKNVHINTKEVSEGNFPVYTSSEGLILKVDEKDNYEKALLFYMNEQYSEALEYINKISNLGEYDSLLNFKGAILEKLGKDKEAKECYDRSAAILNLANKIRNKSSGPEEFQEIKKLIDRDSTLINTINYSTPLLLIAAENKNREVVDLLISLGADINLKDDYNGFNLLHSSVIYYWKDLVEILLSKGMDINSKAKYDITPLFLSVSCCSKEMTEFLLSRGADIKVKTSDGNTLLHTAAKRGSMEMVEFLLSRGEDINARNNSNETPLSTLTKWSPKNRELTIFFISKGADVNATVNLNEGIDSPVLFFVIKNGWTDVVELMISRGADVKAKVKYSGITALHYAASVGKKELVDMLISRGLDVNSKDIIGATPLHFALGYIPGGSSVSPAEGWKEVTETLLAKGADVNAKGYFWRTPLHLTVLSNSKDAVELLLSKGADVNLKDADDRTPLYYAVKTGNKEIENLLLAKGAKP